MIHHILTLSIVGLFFALGATEEPPQINSSEEAEYYGCSCKKRKKNSLKEESCQILACEGHEEELEEETV